MLAAFRKIPAWLLCFAAGAATALAFAPYNFFPVLFITLPLFFVLLRKLTRRHDRPGVTERHPATPMMSLEERS